MEAVFEAYVGDVLRQQLPAGYRLKEQNQSESLVSFGDKNWFKLKPDFTVYGKDSNEPELVLDSKLKLINTGDDKGNGTDKFGLSQSDFYQMHAYGHSYLPGKGNLVLIYPACSTFDKAIEEPFKYSETLKLWIASFDVSAEVKGYKRLKLPGGLEKWCTNTTR